MKPMSEQSEWNLMRQSADDSFEDGSWNNFYDIFNDNAKCLLSFSG